MAVWWAAFTAPILLFVDEPAAEPGGEGLSGISLFLEGLERLKSTFREIRTYKNLFVFLLAFWLYNDGIGTIIRMAAIYGANLGISMTHLASRDPVCVNFSLALLPLVRSDKESSPATSPGHHLRSTFVREVWHFWALAIAVNGAGGDPGHKQ